MQKSPEIFFIMLDALRFDYIRAEHTPFLHKLKSQSAFANVIETFGFNTRPAFFAGLEPEEANQCHLFSYEPEQSIFVDSRYLLPFKFFFEKIGRLGFLRTISRLLAKRRAIKMGFESAATVVSTAHVPLEFLPYFNWAEKYFIDRADSFAPDKTIFDHLIAKNITWSWIGYPLHTGETKNIIKIFHENLEKEVADLVYIHFSELDWTGHKFGPDSPELISKLKELDRDLEHLLTPFIDQAKAIVVFGDHGMVHVEYKVDLLAELKKLDLKVCKDYLYFLDSTQARFWFFNSNAENKIRDLLSNIKGGHIIDDAEKARLKIRFKDRAFGDLIFMIDGPGIVHPSFFDNSEAGPQGMHGYLPDIQDNMTQVFLYRKNSSAQDRGTIKLTQVYDFLLEAINS